MLSVTIYTAHYKFPNSTLNELNGCLSWTWHLIPALYAVDNHCFLNNINLIYFQELRSLSIKSPLTIKSYIFYIHPFALLNPNPYNCQLSSDQTIQLNYSAILINIIINPQIGIRLWVLGAYSMLGTKQALNKYLSNEWRNTEMTNGPTMYCTV